jgi:hypothetical protein
MNPNTLKSPAVVLLSAALLSLAGCSSAPTGETTTTLSMEESATGVAVAETVQMTATVTAINPAKRTVTLTGPSGQAVTYKAGPDVVNFDQIRVGDQVQATLIEEIAVFLRKPGGPPSAGEAATVGLAPRGGKPGVVMADTVEVSARVVAVHSVNRKVMLRLADGRTKTVAVGNSVNLAAVKPGDDVVVRLSEALAVLVEKP